MLAAITLLIVLILSVIAVRTGAIALRLTGVPEDVARFQARSAFTGTGFTTLILVAARSSSDSGTSE